MANIFYVYKHTRQDNGECFYVGKGHNDRAYSKKSRNKHWANIAKKVGYHVKFIAKNIDEELALLTEIEAIDIYKKRGFNLSNITLGGEGVSGLKHSEATKQVLKEKRAKQTICMTESTKRKIGNAHRGVKKGENPEHSKRMTGRKQSLESIAKRVEALKGLKRSPETIEKIRQKHLGAKRSEESKKKMSLAHIGKTCSEETRKKMSESQKNLFANKAHREKHSDAVKLALSSEDVRKKLRTARERRNTEEYCLLQSEKMKKVWAKRKGVQ
jgi:hypothetical protein